MTTLFECDWCGDVIEDREKVAHADVTIGSQAESLHLCVKCAPDHLRQYYPSAAGEDDEERVVETDGGETAEMECNDTGENPYTKSGVVTCDQEVWLQDRVRTAMRMASAIKDEQRVMADDRIVEDALDGVTNGTVVEIINILGLETEGVNLDLKNDRDRSIRHEPYTESDNDPVTDGGRKSRTAETPETDPRDGSPTDGGQAVVPNRTIFDIVHDAIRDADDGDGAPIGMVIQTTLQEAATNDPVEIAQAIAQLETWGDVYRPAPTHVARTSRGPRR